MIFRANVGKYSVHGAYWYDFLLAISESFIVALASNSKDWSHVQREPWPKFCRKRDPYQPGWLESDDQSSDIGVPFFQLDVGQNGRPRGPQMLV